MEMLQQIGVAMAVLGGLGAFFGLVLAMANRVFLCSDGPPSRPADSGPGQTAAAVDFPAAARMPKRCWMVRRLWVCASPAAMRAPRLWPPSWASRRKRWPGRLPSSGAPEARPIKEFTRDSRLPGRHQGGGAWPAHLQIWLPGLWATAPRHVSLTPFTWNKAWPRWTRTSAPAA